MSRPRDFLGWAVEMFGQVALDRDERMDRFLEEAIELAHADGVGLIHLHRIIKRVYGRPAGDVAREIGQAQACLETLAESIGLSSDAEATKEFERVKTTMYAILEISVPETLPFNPDAPCQN